MHIRLATHFCKGLCLAAFGLSLLAPTPKERIDPMQGLLSALSGPNLPASEDSEQHLAKTLSPLIGLGESATLIMHSRLSDKSLSTSVAKVFKHRGRQPTGRCGLRIPDKVFQTDNLLQRCPANPCPQTLDSQSSRNESVLSTAYPLNDSLGSYAVRDC